jgi:hypothetical protein
MAVTALAWNVEVFGARYGNDAAAGVCENLRCALIAAVVADAGAQVLVIQELRRQGVAYLATLQAALNAGAHNDWHYDWIPGSVPRGGAIPPAAFADLGFTITGNNEGYGVLYRQGYVLAQANARSAGEDTGLAGGGAGGNFIDVVVNGQPLAFQEANPNIHFAAPPAAMANLGFPQSTCPRVCIERQTRHALYRSNDVIPLSRGVRRPCQVTIVDANAMVPVPVPVVVYHAPVGQNASPSPLYGALIGFASSALQGAGDKAYVGDLNVANGVQQAILYNYSSAAPLSYANQTFNGGYDPTSVHAAAQNGAGVWQWNLGVGVVHTVRDFGFALGTTQTAVLPIRNWLANNATAAGAFVAVAANRAAITATVLPKFANRLPANAQAVLNAFAGAGAYPAGTDQDTATALLFNLLLSDHLPVQVSRP